MVGGSVGLIFKLLLFGPPLRWLTGKHLGMLAIRPNLDHLRQLAAMAEAGELEPVIDKTYALDEVPDALRYIGAGHALGKVVIKI